MLASATLDLRLHPEEELLRSLGRPRQSVVGLEGDSRDPAVKARVRSLFPDGLDVLFIDGDHSLEGVTGDFESYSGLVRPQGVVVFHDIVPDNGQRTGVSTGGWVGGVPEFWRHLKASDSWTFEEFVDRGIRTDAESGSQSSPPRSIALEGNERSAPATRRLTGEAVGQHRRNRTAWRSLGGIRTPNLLIRSQMLYPLSYERRLRATEST